MRLVIYQPDIPQNLGTMLRTCAGLTVGADIIRPCGFVLSDKQLKRSVMDYINLLDYKLHDSWQDFLLYKHNHYKASRLILLTTKTKQIYHQFNFMQDDLLIVGRESAGVGEEVTQIVDASVTIPMHKEARSLNVAISAAIVLGEAIRQIRK